MTLDRSELMSKMKPVFVPRTLPVVLSREGRKRSTQNFGEIRFIEIRSRYSYIILILLIFIWLPRDGTAIGEKRSRIPVFLISARLRYPQKDPFQKMAATGR